MGLKVVKNKTKTVEAGFDLTFIGLKPWIKLIKEFDLVWTQRKKDYGAFVWGFDGGYIVTGNDPLTGTYMRPSQRDTEIGYASYIGIKGSPAFVKSVVKFIKDNAEYIKDFNPNEREYI